jgi:hypothetical protein
MKRNLQIVFCSLFFLLLYTLSGFALEPKILWRAAVGGKAVAEPLLYSGRDVSFAAVLAQGGRLRCFDVRNGRLLWKRDADGEILPFAALSPEGTLYYMEQRPAWDKNPAQLSAVNARGKTLWTCSLPAQPVRAPLIGADGRVFIIMQGQAECRTERGVLLWNMPRAFADGNDFFTEAVREADAAKPPAQVNYPAQILAAAKGTGISPVADASGRAFVCASDWVLYCWQLPGVQAGSAAPQSRPSRKSYGINRYLALMDEYSDSVPYSLAAVRDRIENGNIGNEELPITAGLMRMAASGTGMPGTADRPSAAGLQADTIMNSQRVEAVRLLGAYGSRETVPFLLELYRRTKFPQIKTAAVEALGEIGQDPDGSAAALFHSECVAADRYSNSALFAAMARTARKIMNFNANSAEQGAMADVLAQIGRMDYLPGAYKAARER